jgi:acyl carrier protein phosphodiesterase
MNLLAHAYLSFNNPEILVGNMISDYLKGNKQYQYTASIQQGIRLHRAIDQFTDQHPATYKGKYFFNKAVGRYSGAFMDIVYDHFLALDNLELKEAEWKIFSENTYQQLELFSEILPEKFAQQLPYMRNHDWLFHYRYPNAIEKSFGGLVKRAKYLKDHSEAYKVFERNYEDLKIQYESFFPDVKKFALLSYHQLTNK